MFTHIELLCPITGVNTLGSHSSLLPKLHSFPSTPTDLGISMLSVILPSRILGKDKLTLTWIIHHKPTFWQMCML